MGLDSGLKGYYCLALSQLLSPSLMVPFSGSTYRHLKNSGSLMIPHHWLLPNLGMISFSLWPKLDNVWVPPTCPQSPREDLRAGNLGSEPREGGKDNKGYSVDWLLLNKFPSHWGPLGSCIECVSGLFLGRAG